MRRAGTITTNAGPANHGTGTAAPRHSSPNTDLSELDSIVDADADDAELSDASGPVGEGAEQPSLEGSHRPA